MLIAENQWQCHCKIHKRITESYAILSNKHNFIEHLLMLRHSIHGEEEWETQDSFFIEIIIIIIIVKFIYEKKKKRNSSLFSIKKKFFFITIWIDMVRLDLAYNQL